MNTQIGTLIRCRDITEKRLGFYQKIGLNILQLAGVDEDYLAPGKEAKQKSENLFALFRRYAFSVPCMFLSYPNQDWTHPKETAGLVPENHKRDGVEQHCSGEGFFGGQCGFYEFKRSCGIYGFIKEPDSFSGVELDGGGIFRYRRLCLSAGMSGINGKFWELSGGLGIIF